MSNPSPPIEGLTQVMLPWAEFTWCQGVEGDPGVLISAGLVMSGLTGTYASANGPYALVDGASPRQWKHATENYWLSWVTSPTIGWTMQTSGSAFTFPGLYMRSGGSNSDDPIGAWSIGMAGTTFGTPVTSMNTDSFIATSGVFSWRLDDGAWSPATRDISVYLTGLTEGPHTFRVREWEGETDDYDLDDANWSEPGVHFFTVALASHVTPPPPLFGPPSVPGTYALFAWRQGVEGAPGTLIPESIIASGATGTHAGANGIYYPVDGASPRQWKHATANYWITGATSSSTTYWTIQASSTTTSFPGIYYLNSPHEADPVGAWMTSGGYGAFATRKQDGGIATSGVFSWRLDDGGWSPPTEDISAYLTGLEEGEHVFRVREQDGDDWGDESAHAFTVAYTPPGAPSTSMQGLGTPPATDNHEPTISFAGTSPGPLRFVLSGAHRPEYNLLYARGDGLVNGYPWFRGVGTDVRVFVWCVFTTRDTSWGNADNPAAWRRAWVARAYDAEIERPPEMHYADGISLVYATSTNPYPYYNNVTSQIALSDALAAPPMTGWSVGMTPSQQGISAPSGVYGSWDLSGGITEFEWKVDGRLDGQDGAWSPVRNQGNAIILKMPPLRDGLHTFRVREMGENGRWSDEGLREFETSLIAAPVIGAVTPSSSANGEFITINWTRSQPTGRGSNIHRYRMNGGAWSPDTSSGTSSVRTFGQLPVGDNLFEIQERGVAANATNGSLALWGKVGSRVLTVGAEGLAFNLFDGMSAGHALAVLGSDGREYLWRPFEGPLPLHFRPEMADAQAADTVFAGEIIRNNDFAAGVHIEPWLNAYMYNGRLVAALSAVNGDVRAYVNVALQVFQNGHLLAGRRLRLEQEYIQESYPGGAWLGQLPFGFVANAPSAEAPPLVPDAEGIIQLPEAGDALNAYLPLTLGFSYEARDGADAFARGKGNIVRWSKLSLKLA